MIQELLKKSLKFTLFLFIFSCSVSEPVIKNDEWDITYNYNIETKSYYETLSLFLYIYDEDGENDIERIFVIDDKNGLYWELWEDNWDIRYIGDNKYLGANNIQMNLDRPIPRVPLRIHVRDLAGEFTEGNVYITKKNVDVTTLKFPEIKKEGESLKLTNYNSGTLELIVNNEVIGKGVVTGEFQAFNQIFNIELSDLEDFELWVKVIDGDLTLRSGPITSF
ncbi:MAG: hypothetical protein JXR64_11845 [Spirochaetales bacterium]|nr:hypothetical protein [Spirochaetales bacterium]